jgi:hypothetical protein
VLIIAEKKGVIQIRGSFFHFFVQLYKNKNR